MIGQLTPEGKKLAQEHADVIKAIRAVIETESGRTYFKYMFKNLGVGTLPEIGLSGEMLHADLGTLRAGNSIFKLVAEAHFEYAGRLLAEVEKERYHEAIEVFTEPESSDGASE